MENDRNSLCSNHRCMYYSYSYEYCIFFCLPDHRGCSDTRRDYYVGRIELRTSSCRDVAKFGIRKERVVQMIFHHLGGFFNIAIFIGVKNRLMFVINLRLNLSFLTVLICEKNNDSRFLHQKEPQLYVHFPE